MKYRIDIWIKDNGVRWRKVYAYEIKPELHEGGEVMDPNTLLDLIQGAVQEVFPFKRRRP